MKSQRVLLIESLSILSANEQVTSLENALKSLSFPESTDADKDMSKNLEGIFKNVEGTEIVNIWGKLMSLLRTACLHGNVENMPETLKSCRLILKNLKTETIKENSSLFETWAPIGAEILSDMKVREQVASVMSRFIEKLSATKPAKSGHDKLWIPVLLGCTKWTDVDLLKEAVSLLREDHLKQMWKWKDNLADAKSVIVNIGKLDLPLDENVNHEKKETVDVVSRFLKKLMDLLKLYKVNHGVQEELAELTITFMERRSILLNALAEECTSLLSFEKNKHIIAGLLRRFLTLYKDEDYPWEDWRSCRAGDHLVNTCVEAYESGKKVTDEVNEAFLDIFKYACHPGHELIIFESGTASIHALMLNRMYCYVRKFSDVASIKRVDPLLPHIFEVVSMLEEGELEERLESNLQRTLRQMSDHYPECMAPFLDKVVIWYIENRSQTLYYIIDQTYPHNQDAIVEKFDQIVEALTFDTTAYVGHSSFLKAVAQNQPELFNEENFRLIMEHHWMHEHANTQIIMAFEKLFETRADLMEPHFIDKVLNYRIQSVMAYHIVKIILCVVANYEEFKERVLEYFINTIKSSTEDHQVYALVDGLRSFVSLFGPELVRPHTDLITKVKDSGSNMTIKNAAMALLDDMEGRSLEKVSAGVEENKGDIENLQIGLAGTKLIVRRVSKTVMKHDKQIKKTKEELKAVDQRVDVVKEDLQETKGKVEEIDMKTMSNAPKWSRDVTKLMNAESDHDWRLLASRLGYSPDDIRGWATQSDPCMALLSEWYATHKTVEATHGVLVALQEMNRLDAAVIVENAMKAAEGVVADEPVDYPEPPEIFLSYQWGHQNEVKLIQRHLEMAGYKCWMDVGQMGGGDKLFEKIDSGIRAAKVIICCVTEKYAKSPNCIREVNLSVNLGKPIIPLLLEKMSWPPKGSMGLIFSEYLFIRFFQRKGEETGDDRIWPVLKFQELLMQLNYLRIMPDKDLVTEEYKNWWIPVVEEIIIQKKDGKPTETSRTGDSPTPEVSNSPDVFISYQWGKQKEISALYQRLTSLGFTCWMDIHQMGGGDSLYDKIDRGVRGCKVMLSSVTQKYALSANCRREVSLADAVKKPIIPLLMEKCDWPPSGPMSMVFTQLLFINFSKDESVQLRWDGPKFDELLQKLHVYKPAPTHEIKQNDGDNSVHKKDIYESKDGDNSEKQPIKEEQQKTRTVAPGLSATDSGAADNGRQAKQSSDEMHNSFSKPEEKFASDQRASQSIASGQEPSRDQTYSTADSYNSVSSKKQIKGHQEFHSNPTTTNITDNPKQNSITNIDQESGPLAKQEQKKQKKSSTCDIL